MQKDKAITKTILIWNRDAWKTYSKTRKRKKRVSTKKNTLIYAIEEILEKEITINNSNKTINILNEIYIFK